MRVYIVCDMEGVSGVVDWKQVTFSDPASVQGRRFATEDLNAVVEGVLAGGAIEIVAWDGHGNFPGALDPELLHPACKLIMNGAQEGPVGRAAGQFDVAMMCGLHAMAGAKGGVLAHSFTRAIAGFWVNGIEMGEIGMNLLGAGELGLPNVFLSGDLAAVREVQALVPEVECVAVKQGIEPYGVLVTPTRKAYEELRAGAERAMALARTGRIKPYQLPKPYTMVTRWHKEEHAEQDAKGRPGARLVDPFTVEAVVDKL
jgi:D-amino peptidase